MNDTDQKQGERRVREVLVDPLLRRGLMKPGSMTKVQFEAMLDDLCARLAYMSRENLASLEVDAAAMPGGKDKDRFPIGNKVLSRAADIQPPDDSMSPLMRGVFGHEIGRQAVEEGWAPELLAWLRANRRWPAGFVLKLVRQEADAGGLRRMRDLDRMLARGEELAPDDAKWRARRMLVLGKCRDIADMSTGAGA